MKKRLLTLFAVSISYCSLAYGQLPDPILHEPHKLIKTENGDVLQLVGTFQNKQMKDEKCDNVKMVITGSKSIAEKYEKKGYMILQGGCTLLDTKTHKDVLQTPEDIVKKLLSREAK